MAAYARWLSEETGRSYRLPAEPEWRHAATADGAAPDPNRNCRSSVRGVVKGGQLVAVGLGTPNAWGLVNHVGNADELVRAEDGLAAVGGRHGDPLAECTVATRRAADGAGDPATGFRLVRELR
jgi:formylglycine-generating enzyme required for sulfatase activity